MTRGSVLEYVRAIRDRYLRGDKKEKKRILDEFVEVAGYHRKGAIRLLRGSGMKQGSGRRGRPGVYKDSIEPLKAIWEASDRLCSKRLHPFIPEMVTVLRQHGEQRIDASVEAELCQMSPATIDRLLQSSRRGGGRRTPSTTRPGSLLKSAIAISTFGDWLENEPGFGEVDLVAHCGESSEGFYLHTLCAVDVARRRRVRMSAGLGQRAGSGTGCSSADAAASSLPSAWYRFGQWQRIHQPKFIRLLQR